MKKILKTFTSLVLCLSLISLFACTQKTTVADSPTTNETITEQSIPTVNKGVLTIATSPDFAPYEFYAIGADKKPYLAGFDIKLAEYIAKELNLKLEIIPMDFDGTIMELAQGKVDMSLAGYSITDERKEVMDFSIVYYGGDQSFVTSKAKENEFKDLASANDSKFTIEAQVGAIQADLMKKYTPKANCVELNKVTDIIAELVSGKADGAFIEKLVAESYVKNYPELVIKFDVPYDTEGTAAGIKKGNTALVNAVNTAIKKCIDSGDFLKYVSEAQELAQGEIIEGLLENQ